MSYILDALKKSEKARRRTNSPDFMDDFGMQPPGQGGRPWPWIAVIVVICSAAGLGWYLGSDEQPRTQAAVTIPKAAQPSAAPPAVLTPEPAHKNVAAEPRKIAVPPAQRPADAETPKPAAPKKIYAIAELPDSVRQALPAMSISTHIYSEVPSERLVAINGTIGREGREIFKDIVIETVTPDGVVLKSQGYRFKLGLR